MDWKDSLRDIKKSMLKQRESDSIPIPKIPEIITKPQVKPTAKTLSQYGLSSQQTSQVQKYINIYKKESFEKHWEVNVYITDTQQWDHFSDIRSLNDHGDSIGVPGILPKFYAIVCEILEITSDNGARLDKAEKY